jgi:hypothetical protein
LVVLLLLGVFTVGLEDLGPKMVRLKVAWARFDVEVAAAAPPDALVESPSARATLAGSLEVAPADMSLGPRFAPSGGFLSERVTSERRVLRVAASPFLSAGRHFSRESSALKSV